MLFAFSERVVLELKTDLQRRLESYFLCLVLFGFVAEYYHLRHYSVENMGT